MPTYDVCGYTSCVVLTEKPVRNLNFRSQTLSLALLVVGFCCSVLWAGDNKGQEVVAKHLDSIGSAQVRSQVKSRVIQGFATYRVLVGGTGAIDGKCVVASEGVKANYLFKINASGYRGENFITDGDKTSIAGTYTDKRRSEFGYFMYNHDLVFREGLLGGVWSTNWPFLDLEAHKAKIHFDGIKKVDGKELLAVHYQPKKNPDLDIIVYFDPQTYQHVMTTYSMETSVSNTGGELAQAGKQRRRTRLEEHFSNFGNVDGLTLPMYYDLRFSVEMENGFTKTVEWEVRELNIANNMSIDPRSFQAVGR